MPENGTQEAAADSPVKSDTNEAKSSGFSPHSTTTTPPQVAKTIATTEDSGAGSATEEEEDTGPLKQCLAAAIKLSSTISRQHAERMLQIIADLLMGTIETGEFQRRVQEVIRLPFRPLVPPLLDKQVPSLRKEIAGQLLLARHQHQQQNNNNNSQVKQTTEQVKSLLLDDRPAAQPHQQQRRPAEEEAADMPVLSVWQVFQPSESAAAGTGSSTRKRRASASLVENSSGTGYEMLGSGNHNKADHSGRNAELSTPKRPNVESSSARKNLSVSSSSVWTPPKVGTTPQQPTQTSAGSTPNSSPPFRHGDEEWANIHTMLNCILSMVEKTRKALAILQQRSQDPPTPVITSSSEPQWQHIQQKHHQPRREAVSHYHVHQQAYEASELRRQAGELIAQTLKSTEDRVSQVKRKAEEAVQDVRRAAMAELQRAMSAERIRAERLAAEARRQGAEEALLALGRHSQAKEGCWNCARRASETCSGCNIARYCSTFCQHKHWEVHHKICGRVSQLMMAATAAAAVATGSNPVGPDIGRPPAGNSPTDLRSATSSSKPTSPQYIQ